jgi:hypothetical protein
MRQCPWRLLALVVVGIASAALAMREEDNPDVFGSLAAPAETQTAILPISTRALDAVSTRALPAARPRAPSPLEQFEISATASIEQAHRPIHLNDTVSFVVRLSWKGAIGDVTVENPEPPMLTGLELLSVQPSNKTSPESGKAMAEFLYLLRPTQKGVVTIGAVDLRYKLRESGQEGTLRTASQALTILPVPTNWSKIVMLAVAAIAAGVIVLYVVATLVRARSRRAVLEQEAKPSPYERILGELSSTRLLLIEGEIKTFYDKIAQLTKGFLSVIEGKHVMNMTSEELASYLGSREVNQHMREKVFSILSRCDNVRYAGSLPSPAEHEEILNDLRMLIETGTRKDKTGGQE